MTTTPNLDEELTRFTRSLAALAEQGRDGQAKARQHRARLALYVSNLCDVIEGKNTPCPKHAWNKAHNCAVCHSEDIARVPHENPDPATLPPNPAADVDARWLGEHQPQEQ